jgi:polysaccharide biosynthesis transport protein
MRLIQLLRMIGGRKAVFLATLFSVVAAVAVVSLLSPKEYVAELALVVDTKRDDPLADAAVAPQLVPAYLATQAEIIRSRNVALKVIERLRLHEDPQLTADFRAAGGSGDLRPWLVNKVLQSVDARASRNSNIILVTYASSDPQTAATMANAFAEAYIQTSLELKVDPARRQATWFETQVQQLRAELVAAQDNLARYQREQGVIGADDARLDVENARLQELSNQLVKAQAAMYDAETRRGGKDKGSPSARIEELPDIASNPLLQNLKSDLAQAEAKLAEVSERYGVNHPQYRSAAAELAALRSKFNSEVAAARGSLAQAAGIARQQVAEVQAAHDEQKARIIDLKRQRDELTVLHRDVESARGAYDAALQRANQTRLESRVDRTNIAILNPATPPLWPDSPRVLLNIAVALFAGLALAIGLTLTLELLNRRVRSGEDLLDLIDLPVLVELPPPAARRRRLPQPSQRAIPLRTTAA